MKWLPVRVNCFSFPVNWRGKVVLVVVDLLSLLAKILPILRASAIYNREN